MSELNHVDLGVSRETLERLNVFAELLLKWTTSINLISKGSHTQIWDRHIRDSIQVFEATTPGKIWCDLGSGGGLPGIIIGILAKERAPNLQTILIESDQRKAVFLRTAIRETGVNAHVICDRIESVEPQSADTVSARALADLSTLLTFADRHLASTGTAVFPKGENWKEEFQKANQEWNFDLDVIKSKIEDRAAILKLRNIERV